MESSSKYFYAKGEEQIGPHSLQEIESKILDGEIERDTKVWTKGMSDWLGAEDISSIAGTFDEIPPPTPEMSFWGEATPNWKAARTPTRVFLVLMVILHLRAQREMDINLMIVSALQPIIGYLSLLEIYRLQNYNLRFPFAVSWAINFLALVVSVAIGMLIYDYIIWPAYLNII